MIFFLLFIPSLKIKSQKELSNTALKAFTFKKNLKTFL